MNIKIIIGISVVLVGIFLAGMMVGKTTRKTSASEQNVQIKETVVASQTAAVEEALDEEIEETDEEISEDEIVAASLDFTDVSDDGISAHPLFGNLSKEEYEKMIREAMTLGQTNESESLLRVLFVEWAKQDPLGALALARELDRDDFAYISLRQMSMTDPDSALLWIEQNTSKSDDGYYLTMSIYEGLAKVDPQDAVARAEQLAAGPQREQLLSIVLDEWAKKDVHAAFDWFDTIETFTPEVDYMYSKVMSRYIEQDMFAAAELISELSPGDNQVGFASNVAYKLAQADINYALSWVEKFEGNAKRYAMQSIVDSWASGPNGLDALNYVMGNMDAPYADEMFMQVAHKLSNEHGEALASAMANLEESQQTVAANQLASFYMMNNRAKFDQLIDSIQPGNVRDSAIVSGLRTFNNSDPSKAFNLAGKISNDSSRLEQVRNVMKAWAPVAPEKAERALNASNALTPSEKENLINEIFKDLKADNYILPTN